MIGKVLSKKQGEVVNHFLIIDKFLETPSMHRDIAVNYYLLVDVNGNFSTVRCSDLNDYKILITDSVYEIAQFCNVYTR